MREVDLRKREWVVLEVGEDLETFLNNITWATHEVFAVLSEPDRVVMRKKE